jgi:hypothetical protein
VGSPSGWNINNGPHCSICLGGFESPLQLQCSHTFCHACIDEWCGVALLWRLLWSVVNHPRDAVHVTPFSQVGARDKLPHLPAAGDWMPCGGQRRRRLEHGPGGVLLDGVSLTPLHFHPHLDKALAPAPRPFQSTGHVHIHIDSDDVQHAHRISGALLHTTPHTRSIHPKRMHFCQQRRRRYVTCGRSTAAPPGGCRRSDTHGTTQPST